MQDKKQSAFLAGFAVGWREGIRTAHYLVSEGLPPQEALEIAMKFPTSAEGQSFIETLLAMVDNAIEGTPETEAGLQEALQAMAAMAHIREGHD